MKKTVLFLFSFVIISGNSYSQLYEGPAQGVVQSGVTVTTDNFSDMVPGEPLPYFIVKGKLNITIPELVPDHLNKVKPTAPEGTNFVLDESTLNNGADSPSILLKNFPGVPRTSFIPPDPSIAVGPTHIVGGVNSTFRIWDKNGNVLKTIQASLWLNSLGLGIGSNVSDPKISYDHFAKRWIMTWITPPIGPFSYDVVSVSDDSIPLGTWYNYAMRNDVNGSTPAGVWRDYEGVGFDASAIYITGRGFTFNNAFVYSYFRIINKAQIYANTGGPVSWFDMWDLKDPSNLAPNDGVRPSIIYGNPGEFYLFCHANSPTGTYVSLYKVINPLTSPSMTGLTIPVVQYTSPPPSAQLGTTATITSGGTSSFRCEPVYRGGFLYAVHAVRSNGVNSSFKYYKINVNANTAEQDITYGAPGFYFSYPAIAVDKNYNILITFSRSADTEYIGAYYTSRLNNDPPNTFNPSSPLQTGKGTYINTGQNNRWGDYMGAWVDATDDEDFWIMTEFADLSNLWSVWVGNVRVAPFSTARVVADKDTMQFGNIEVNFSSDTQSVKVVNYGNSLLTISNIQSSNSEFSMLNALSFPINLNFNDSVVLKIVFRPTTASDKLDSIRISSNDVVNPNKSVYLKGKGYIINPVQANLIYGVTGTQSGGILLNINPATGAGTSIGASGYSQLNGLSIRPSNNQLYASITASPVTQLLRINSLQGDAYPVSPIPVASIRSLAFDLNDALYCSTSDGKLYQYNLSSGDTDFVGNTSISNLFGLSFNPLNGQLWGISASGAVYKISKQTAVSQTIGSTGVSPNTDIAFSKTGILYGISGIGGTINRLIRIDTSNGSGSVIGTNTGYAGINGISISPEIVGIQNITTNIPDSYELYQNYPNPFNPVTNIRFDLPSGSNVKLIVYDILGKEVNKLVDEKLEAGSYEYSWNAADLSSGVYFYRIQADPSSGGGQFFTEVRRMILIK